MNRDCIGDVYFFHTTAGTPIAQKINRDLVIQTLRHLEEELGETHEAKERFELAETPEEEIKAVRDICDGFVDLAYVAFQGLIAMGLTENVAQRLWNAVHDANTKKLQSCSCGVRGEADPNCSVCKGVGLFVTRNPSGKILKPAGWTPPPLEQLLPERLFW